MASRKIIFLGILVLAVCAVAAFFLLSNKTSAGSFSRTSGVVFGAAGVENSSATLASISDGISYFRMDISLNSSEESFVRNMSADGGNFMGILDYETVGAQIKSGSCFAGCGWNLSTWNSSVEAALEAYPEVHVWEIWNEPQISNFQDGFQDGNPENYYLMLKSAYALIKAHNATDTVLCLGGDSVYSSGDTPDQQDYEWAAQLWSYGAGKYCDGISLHAYTGFTYLMNQTPEGGTLSVGDIFNVSLAEYENLTGKPIWITEFGIPSNNAPQYGANLGDSDVKQAEFVNQTVALFGSKPYVQGLIWFHLVGEIDPPYDLDFGLLNSTTLAPKPAMYAYMKLESQK
jgi:hypothetical protein